jgi:hypothetical protein
MKLLTLIRERMRMNLIPRKNLLNRSVWVLAFFGLSTVYIGYSALGNPSGYTGVTNKAGNNNVGCSCHCTSKNAATSVAFIPPADTNFFVGKTYQFMLQISNPAEFGAGCDISTFSGVLTAGTDGLKKSGTELTQKTAKAFVNGKINFTFNYTAPTKVGFDTLYAVGNAVNGDGSNGDDCSDLWNLAPKFVVNVRPSSGVEASAVATEITQSVSPNPSRSETKLVLTNTKASQAEITVYDAAGRSIRQIALGNLPVGKSSFTIATSNLPAGEYFVRSLIDGVVEKATKLAVVH